MLSAGAGLHRMHRFIFHCPCNPGALTAEGDRKGISKRALALDEVHAPFSGCGTGTLHGSFLRETQKSELDFVPLEIL